MYMRLFLQGPPKSGTTQLLIQALSALRLQAGGYIIMPLVDNDCSKWLGMLEPGEAAASPMPYSLFQDTFIGVPGQVDTELFRKKCIAVYRTIREKGLGILDQVGGLELTDRDLSSQLEEILTSEIPCAGVLCHPQDATDPAAFQALFSRLQADGQTLILDVTTRSKQELTVDIRSWADEIADWMRHRKFDPLERPRFRYAKQYRKTEKNIGSST